MIDGISSCPEETTCCEISTGLSNSMNKLFEKNVFILLKVLMVVVRILKQLVVQIKFGYSLKEQIMNICLDSLLS